MVTPKTKDVWDILQEAIEAGWEDSGLTELLETTRQRALEYLHLHQFKPIASKVKPDRC